jgi:hypothetical protein
MTTELTPIQAEVLEAIKKAGKADYMHYMGRFGGDYWYVSGYSKHRCTAQVKALIKKGYLKVQKTNQFGDAVATPTEPKTVWGADSATVRQDITLDLDNPEPKP